MTYWQWALISLGALALLVLIIKYVPSFFGVLMELLAEMLAGLGDL